MFYRFPGATVVAPQRCTKLFDPKYPFPSVPQDNRIDVSRLLEFEAVSRGMKCGEEEFVQAAVYLEVLVKRTTRG